jgi:hypothetical protein
MAAGIATRRWIKQGVTMRKFSPIVAPLGRLHDPLRVLAERVRAALRIRRRTVSVDDKGRVFIEDTEQFEPDPKRSIVGSYDLLTPIASIENDLRLALRERASQWITDWNAPAQVRQELPMETSLPPKKRRRRAAAGASRKRPLWSASASLV